MNECANILEGQTILTIPLLPAARASLNTETRRSAPLSATFRREIASDRVHVSAAEGGVVLHSIKRFAELLFWRFVYSAESSFNSCLYCRV